ncbi:MAG: hypothetical protein RL129_110 [Actinomycetota bacterium]|jgi:hypothetical protein
MTGHGLQFFGGWEQDTRMKILEFNPKSVLVEARSGLSLKEFEKFLSDLDLLITTGAKLDTDYQDGINIEIDNLWQISKLKYGSPIELNFIYSLPISVGMFMAAAISYSKIGEGTESLSNARLNWEKARKLKMHNDKEQLKVEIEKQALERGVKLSAGWKRLLTNKLITSLNRLTGKMEKSENAKIIHSAYRFTDKKKSRKQKDSQPVSKKTGTHSGRRAKTAAKKAAPKSKPKIKRKSAAKRAPKSSGKRRSR